MAVPEYFEFQDRTKVMFAVGAIAETGKEAAKLGAKKVIVVADAIVSKLGHVARLEKILNGQGIALAAVFDEIPENSEVAVVEKGRKIAEECGADMIVTIGGGSVMDTAKCMNVLLSLGGNLMDDYQGAGLITTPLKPMIALPTTSGTGSEVTFAAVILDKAENMKIGFISPYLAPTVAILDPELTATMPPKLTASTGMDALTHAIESMHSTSRGPLSDAFAEYAIRKIFKYLPIATRKGENMEARSEMLIASNMAGIGFTNSMVGIVHALAHATGGISHVPHGVANSIYLPHGMEFNLESCPDVYAAVARAIGLETSGLGDVEAGGKAIEAVKKLTIEIGLPQKLSEAGVKEEDLESIADYTLMDGTMVTNPREVMDPAEALEVIRKAF